MKKDVIIVGAGPAGLSAAEVLAREGKDVLVLEQKKIIGDKVCAGGISLKDLELGIPKSLLQRSFKKVIVHSPKETVEVKLDKPFMATIDRKDLGKWLARKAKKAGAEIRTETSVLNIGHNFIRTAENKINFDYLIGADGANSIVRRHLGLPTKKVLEAFQYILPQKFKDMELYFDADRFGPTYAWIFPYAKTTSIGSGADLQYKKFPAINIKKNLDSWCRQKKFDLKNSVFQAHTINYDYRGHEFGSKFLVGDAAGFASGLTGGGMYQAMRSGIDVAKKILDPKYDCPGIKKLLRVKAIEETVLGTLMINKTWTKIEHYLILNLIKSKWMNQKIAEHVQ